MFKALAGHGTWKEMSAPGSWQARGRTGECKGKTETERTRGRVGETLSRENERARETDSENVCKREREREHKRKRWTATEKGKRSSFSFYCREFWHTVLRVQMLMCYNSVTQWRALFVYVGTGAEIWKRRKKKGAQQKATIKVTASRRRVRSPSWSSLNFSLLPACICVRLVQKLHSAYEGVLLWSTSSECF